ncbi:MAG: nucleotidyl transferase AbiEii/AbiGii toxin family protein [Deltaproteobacteria bacterium]|nr:nucleotidyl transferase AbiEii/AbiGii toxin family protein [Deltaproteobacteria bacterium]
MSEIIIAKSLGQLSPGRLPFAELLAFKGGTASKKCYLPDYRFSEDPDYTLREDAALNVIQEHRAHVFEKDLPMECS